MDTERTALVERARRHAERQAEASYISGLDIGLQRIQEEYVPALRDLRGRVDLYERMANDPGIKKQLRLNILPLISNVRWKVEGGDAEARDLVAANLLRQGDRRFWCDTSWNQRLFEHLQCLKYGFAVHGKTWRTIDGYRVFGRLTYLHPRSLRGAIGPWEWDPGTGDLVAIHRSYRRPDLTQVVEERIPVEEVFIMAWELTGENWEGTALIRSMYRAFVEKDLAAKIQMINLQNVGVGIPDAELAAGDGPKQRDAIESIVRSLRGGSKERAYIVRSPGQKVGFLTAGANMLDATPIINNKNVEFSGAGATEFMNSGETETGSRAGKSVQLTMSLVQIDAVRACVEDVINQGSGYLPGLVEELVDANFSEVKEYPRIVGSRISPTEQLDNIPLIGQLVQYGLLRPSLGLANEALRRLGWPEMDEADWEASAPAPSIGGRPEEVRRDGRQDPRDDENGRRFGLAEKKTPDDASQRRRRSASYRWLKSTPA